MKISQIVDGEDLDPYLVSYRVVDRCCIERPRNISRELGMVVLMCFAVREIADFSLQMKDPTNMKNDDMRNAVEEV